MTTQRDMTTQLEAFLDEFGDKRLTYAEVRAWFTPECEAEFWERVNKHAPNGCWEWTAGKWDEGYGKYYVGRKGQRAHRLVYMLARERDIPAYIDERDIPNPADAEEHIRAAVVRHRCDNPPCCNPAHLVLGTHKENSADRDERERTEQARRQKQEQEDRENVQAVYHCFLNHCIPFVPSRLGVNAYN